jgi:hypothetical protein
MSRVDVMISQGLSYSVKFLEVTRMHSKNKDLLICVFEGKDEKYFCNRLDLIVGQGRWAGINTGGKKPVLDLAEALSHHSIYQNANYACFIDRDFEDWFVNKNPERVYITPTYSIENFFVTESCFTRVLSSEFEITEFNDFRDEYKKCMDAFNSRLEEFTGNLLEFNIWVKAHRIMERDSQGIKKLNVSNVKTKDIVSVDLDKISTVYTPTDFTTIFKDLNSFTFCSNAIKEAEATLKACNRASSFRGKQQMDFYRDFLIKLKNDRTSQAPNFFTKNGKAQINLSKDNIISELSQYADTPDCLNTFLQGFAA